jgi:hypothetical protein
LQYNLILINSTIYSRLLTLSMACARLWHLSMWSKSISSVSPLDCTTFLARLFRRPNLVVYAGGREWRRVIHPPSHPLFISCRTFFFPWFCVTREKLYSVKETTVQTFSPWRVADIGWSFGRDLYLPFKVC